MRDLSRLVSSARRFCSFRLLGALSVAGIGFATLPLGCSTADTAGPGTDVNPSPVTEPRNADEAPRKLLPDLTSWKLERATSRPKVVTLPPDRPAPHGELIVKFKSEGAHELTECAETLLAARKSFQLATADRSDSLDRLMTESGVLRAHALLPGRAGLSTSVAKARFQAQYHAAAARFQQRTARLSSMTPQSRPPVNLTNLYVLEVPGGTNLDALSKRYAADPHVEYAQPNYQVKAVFTPNDPFYATTGSWGQTVDDLWGVKKIGLATAWDTARGQNQVVAVVDTGLDLAHPDIQANVWVNTDEIANNGLDDDNNGLVNDRNGWDYASFDSNPTDDMGHGTHVAGIIAAVGNNGVGISGVAPQAKLMPVKALDGDGNGSTDSLVNSIRYAADNGADVINNSWGCGVACPSSPAIEDAVAYAYGLGATIVFASGNSADDIINYSPQNRPEPIVVGATDPNDAVAFFSNVGLIDVTAPGGGVNSTPPSFEPFRNILSLKASGCNPNLLCPPELVVGTQYLRQAGTSMAAPFVSGIAALILQQHPTYSPEQVRQVLRRSSVNVNTAGFDAVTGYGRVSANQALTQPVPLSAVITSPVNPTLSAVTSQPVRGTASGTGFANYRVEIGAGLAPTTFTTITTATTAVNNGQLALWNPSTAAEGIHTLRVVATTTDGRTYEDRQRVFVDNVVITEPNGNILSFPTNLDFRAAGATQFISGTVSPANFSRYAVNIRKSDGTLLSSPNITLVNGGLQRIVNGNLAQWNTTGVPADAYKIEVVVTLTNNTTITESKPIIVDPTLKPDFPFNLGFLGSVFGNTIIANAASDHLTAADINGNGTADILIGYGSTLRIFDHTGAQLPGWPQNIDPLNQGAILFKGPAVGDVTGDGSPEIVASANLGQLFVWRSNGTLLPGFPLTFGDRASAAAIADINNNGTNEIILTSWADGFIRVINSAGTMLPGWPVQIPNSFGLTPPSIGDLDKDGQKEIVVVDAVVPTSIYVYSSTGQLKTGWPKSLNIAPGSPALATYPALGDLDGDGDLEIVLGSQDGTVYAWHHTGAAVTGWPTSTTGQPANSATLGDIDGVSGLEVLTGVNNVMPNVLYARRSNGTLLSGWPLTRPVSGAGSGFNPAALADIDADGKADVISSGDVTDDPLRTLHAFRFDGTNVTSFPKFTAWASPWPSNSPVVANLDTDPQLEIASIDLFANLYVWETTAPATGPRPWPMFQQNAALTGQAPVACTPETNTQFCSRLAKNCGSVTAPDNCGVSRTVSSCGTCTSPATCGGGGTPNVCGAPAIPAAPTNLVATAGNAQVSLTWTASSGATSYNVRRSTTSGTGYVTVASNVTTTSFVNTGLTNGTLYFYVVTATNAAGTSGNSNQASARPAAPAPAAPTNLVAAAGNAQVSLTWTASAGATSYTVLRGTTNGGPYGTTVASNVTATSFVNTGLTNGTTYFYVVRAVNAAGTSGNSNQASATPAAATAPAAPTNLAATAGNAQVSLTWTASAGATSYTVLRGTTNGGPYGTTVASNVTVTSFVNTGLTNGTTYFYVVRAVNAAGTSGNSNQASATPAGGGGGQACTGAITVTGGQSGNFNTTGPVCYRTSDTINGWGCSNAGGRTVTVNGTAVTCGQTPLPAKLADGFRYFSFSAGSVPFTSFFWF